jgi:two-component system, cell cycle sensor histidine kinase and response regulator CckA
MPDGGTLRIGTRSIRLSEGDSYRFGSLPAGSYVEIALADTGVGMDEEVRGQVFEPFFTTTPGEGHRGLGLSIVYGVVRQASGHIELESEPGRGTTVRIYLPAKPPRRDTAAVHEEPVDADRKMTVLVAEDEPGLRRLMCMSLEQAGFTVLEAADGRAAVDVGERHPGRIDLLVSDVIMPGWGGPEAARRLLADRPEMRVMFVSGYAPDTLGDLTATAGEVVLLPKPFAMSDLVLRARAVSLGIPFDAAAVLGADRMDGT